MEGKVEANALDYMETKVMIKIDRPLGTKHPKHGFEYPVNYGYIPNTVSGDGEELDAYLLGVTEPVEEYEGICIAVIHRTNDNDDKLIVVPADADLTIFTDEEIRKQTHFQEQWFESEILRKHEKSCGCIVIDGSKVLLIQQSKGHWGFPKGHVEDGETEEQTAIRETKEETNVDVEVDTSKRFEDQYLTDKGTVKHVVFFIARKVGGNEEMQQGEIKAVEWLTFDEALERLTFENTKKLLRKVMEEE